jgi:hypothetical protein
MMDADRTKMDGDGRMDAKMDGKRVRLVKRGRNIFHSPYEVWDLGDGHSLYVDFYATGGKAIRELGYEIEEDER